MKRRAGRGLEAGSDRAAGPVAAGPDDAALDGVELALLMEAVYRRYQHDFRHYAPSSMRRRVRQALDALGIQRVSDLQHAVLRDEDLFARLLQYLTVQVSDMFRDPAYFLLLRQQVVPELATYPSLKFWVAGCSRGEEAWSLAVLLHEEGLLERSIIYATDINPAALQQAESGVYDLDRAAQFSRNYQRAGGRASLADYWHTAYDRLVFDRALRRQIVFADHSLATDTVFSEVHLVSCRNVLIYFDDSLQARAVGLFRDALVRRGFLGLGSRETLQFGPHALAFRALPQLPADVRWYQRA